MATIQTYDLSSGAKGEKDFGGQLGDKILYRTLKDAVVQYQANSRQGDAHTKTRGEIAGNTAKPWKQKKTGRARAGDKKSPIWRGGGTTFGPRNTRNWTYHLPRKQRLSALRSALAGKIQDAEVHEIGAFQFDAPSSKVARKVLGDLAPKGSVLVLLAEGNESAYKSFRNFPQVTVRVATDANAYDLLASKWLLAEEGALENLAARFGKLEG